MFRNIYGTILLYLANRAIKKYNSKLIFVYGWDWSEGLREAVYNLLRSDHRVRRNTAWLDWDFALPLFILGLPYSSKVSRFRLNIYIARAIIYLFLPNRYKNNYLVVSLHAKRQRTFDYWLKHSNVDAVIVLPFADGAAVDIERIQQNGFTKMLDLRQSALASPAVEESVPFMNNIQKKLFQLLSQVHGDYLRAFAEYEREDLIDAIVKVDWESMLLERISHNLTKEVNE